MIRSEKPDVVITDIRIGLDAGLSGDRGIKVKECPDTYFIVTAYSESLWYAQRGAYFM